MTSKKRTASEASSPESSAALPVDAPSFESALSELESIIEHLESEELTLDSALSYFERGISLMRICDAHLNLARGKITELFRGEDGAFAEKVLGASLESFLNQENNHD